MEELESFYKELKGREEYLETLENTDENDIRKNEINLAIVRIQQILLNNLVKEL